jgi:hypothetical protein
LECEMAFGTLIRINPREAHSNEAGISIPCGALEAVTAIDEALQSKL